MCLKLKISVITACYNSEKTIRDTLNSVFSQSSIDFEHIVVDGNSIDDTVKVIHKSKCAVKLISESDNGIYDAMNKGIALATGDVIGTLNADDFYVDDDVLTEVAKIFEDESIDACFADLVYVKQDDVDKVVRYWKSQPYKQGLFERGWMPAHPTFFARKKVYEKYGAFNLDYKIAADFELLFRLIEIHKINTKYIPKVFVKMRLGGTTNKSITNIIKQNKEIIQLLNQQYDDFSILKFFLSKIVDKLSQFFIRPVKK